MAVPDKEAAIYRVNTKQHVGILMPVLQQTLNTPVYTVQ